MLKIFVDTNVIFEHALKREYYIDCIALFKMVEDQRIECYCSAYSFYIFSYVLRKHHSLANARLTLQGYLAFLNILSATREQFHSALTSSFKDIEDGFQYYTALQKSDYFVTLNKKDFEKHLLPELDVYTPAEILALIG